MKKPIIIISIVIVAAAVVFFLTAGKSSDHSFSNSNTETETVDNTLSNTVSDSSKKNPISSLDDKITDQDSDTKQPSSSVSWENSGQGYVAIGTPPDCPDPLFLATPVDLSKVNSILYPGQTRGGGYNAHGGFRFDGQAGDDITVTIPMDALLFEGSRYIQSGSLQYLFSFIDSCGIMYRFDHLSILSEKFQTYADQLPEPKVDDSRTTNYREAIPVSTGEVLATGVGFDDNVLVDFGVYDLRQLNNAAQDPDWAYNDRSTFAPYGVCWFDLLSAADAAIVRALPAGSSESGSQSDYCL